MPLKVAPAEIVQNLHRLALNGQIHEEEVEDESGEEYTQGEHESDRVGPQSGAIGFTHLDQREEGAHEYTTDQAQDDSLRGNSRRASLKHPGLGLMFQLGGGMGFVGESVDNDCDDNNRRAAE